MVRYIIDIATDINKKCQASGEAGEVLFLLPSLIEELNRLDPRDFQPDSRSEFVIVRARSRRWLNSNGSVRGISIAKDYPLLTSLTNEVINVLESYEGEGSGARQSREFAFVCDMDLKHIIARDYRELCLYSYPMGAWKSTVILAGSILEAILLDQITQSPTKKTAALNSSKAPKRRGGVVRDIDNDEWRLVDLIEVSADIRIIPQERANSIDQVIRDYRNFVHPKKEIRSQHPCKEAEAMMALGALNGVCDHLEP